LTGRPIIPREVAEEAVVARGFLKDHIHETPLDFSNTFSKMTGAEIYLKLENLQKTGSFKVRGAMYKVARLREQGVRLVVTASAGNHAQGVAYAASVAGLKSIIVMPETAPVSKINATRSYGAEVILHGRVYDDSYKRAVEICAESGGVFLHPFDDVQVVAGQGTIALEILERMEPEAVVVPIGGGGLISGIASVLKTRLGSRVRVYGVQSRAAPSMLISLERGRPTEVEVDLSIADGIIAKKPGELTLQLVSECVDDIVLVDDSEVSRAMFLLLERSKTVVEGAGASSLAALLSGKIDVRGRRVVAMVSGGNVDMTVLSKIVIREMMREGRMVRIKGTLPDRPGELKRVVDVLARARCNIVDIEHDRMQSLLTPGWASIQVTFEIPAKEKLRHILGALRRQGHQFEEV
jgi:threonine dehydratase